MIELHGVKTRVVRLRELAEALGKEVTAQKAAEGLLTPLERKRRLGRLQDALARQDEARVVLAGVVKRMGGRRSP